MQSCGPLYLLSDCQSVSLSSWFGDPLSREQAKDLLSGARDRLRHSSIGADLRFRLQLAELICAFWSGREVQASHANLVAVAREERNKALLELCYGQLLMAVRQRTSWLYLDHGFQRAAHLFDPEDYFLVLKRHDLLRELPCSEQPAIAAGLEVLLSEAAVIRRLRGAGIWRPDIDLSHRDTLD
jgi:hypothetical protein